MISFGVAGFTMRGFVPTPDAIVDEMIARLFQVNQPTMGSRILDPGCGNGAFIDGIIRWCQARSLPIPRIVGVENHFGRAQAARARYKKYRSISIECRDFLASGPAQFDYVIGNPPYVSILNISKKERETFRARYDSARGRFDLYMLFFEQALRELKPDGRLVFITPEKFLYVNSCKELRTILVRNRLVEITLVGEDSFKGLVTYPTITTVDKCQPTGTTMFIDRTGTSRQIALPSNGSSFLPLLGDDETLSSMTALEDICVRVSCGVATGADAVFVRDVASVPKALRRFAHPTISGRQLIPNNPIKTQDVMLIPYDTAGMLLDESRLGELGKDLALRKRSLLKRVCTKRKPWYAFHDSVPFEEMLRPKILCKDITKDPNFWPDYDGVVVPRHSVYYIVPKDPSALDSLLAYLNGPDAQGWLRANCQRAANGFLRMQSSVIKRLPVPADLFHQGDPKKTRRERTAA